MQTARRTLVGQRSLRLVYATSLPDTDPKAVVVLVHGYGEHMGRYAHVVEALVQRGYAVYTIDHRGHGGSEGVRAHVEHFDYFVADLDLLVQKAQAAYPDLPLCMIGHSMGGLIAVRYALRYQEKLACLVVTGAALQIGNDASPLLKKLSWLIATVAPQLGVAGLKPGTESILSRDPTIQEAFDADPLCYKGKVKARMAYEMLSAGADTRKHMAQLTLPLLIMHGAEDKLTDPQGSVQLYEQARSADKTLKLWPGCRHELYNEPEKDEVIDFELGWLDEHVQRSQHALAALHPA